MTLDALLMIVVADSKPTLTCSEEDEGAIDERKTEK